MFTPGRMALLAVVTLIAVLVAIEASYIPELVEVCGEADSAGNQECAKYHVLPALLIVLSAEIEAHQGFFTVLATAVIAVFTARLFKATTNLKDSTDKLWVASERQRTLTSNIANRQSMETRNAIGIARSSADAAREANRLSQELFVSEQRPWIKMGVVPRSLSFKNGEMTLRVVFTLENVGKTIAMNVDIWPRLVAPAIGIENFNPNQILADLVADRKKSSPSNWGYSLFPR
jgi:hypothetical protein